jgi:hypothetical protein
MAHFPIDPASKSAKACRAVCRDSAALGAFWLALLRCKVALQPPHTIADQPPKDMPRVNPQAGQVTAQMWVPLWLWCRRLFVMIASMV